MNYRHKLASDVHMKESVVDFARARFCKIYASGVRALPKDVVRELDGNIYE